MEFSQLSKGQRLKIARKAAKLTQDELGLAIGVGKSQISNIENGSSELTSENAIVLSRKLGITTDWLLSGIGEPGKNLLERINNSGNYNQANPSNSISIGGHDTNKNSNVDYPAIIQKLEITIEELKQDKLELKRDKEFLKNELEDLRKRNKILELRVSASS